MIVIVWNGQIFRYPDPAAARAAGFNTADDPHAEMVPNGRKPTFEQAALLFQRNESVPQ